MQALASLSRLPGLAPGSRQYPDGPLVANARAVREAAALGPGARPGRRNGVWVSVEPYAARFSPERFQMVSSEATRCAMSASEWAGEGVTRRRSVPRGTVG